MDKRRHDTGGTAVATPDRQPELETTKPDYMGFRVQEQLTSGVRECLLLAKHRPELRSYGFQRVSDVARMALELGLEQLRIAMNDTLEFERVRAYTEAHETGKKSPYPDPQPESLRRFGGIFIGPKTDHWPPGESEAADVANQVLSTALTVRLEAIEAELARLANQLERGNDANR